MFWKQPFLIIIVLVGDCRLFQNKRSGQSWARWVRRFENFVVAKDIEDDAKTIAMLLHYADEAYLI